MVRRCGKRTRSRITRKSFMAGNQSQDQRGCGVSRLKNPGASRPRREMRMHRHVRKLHPDMAVENIDFLSRRRGLEFGDGRVEALAGGRQLGVERADAFIAGLERGFPCGDLGAGGVEVGLQLGGELVFFR